MKIRTFGDVHWRKSSRSADHGTDCVEVAAITAPGCVLTRDSKDPAGPVLSFAQHEWSVFLDEAKRGTFDLA
ncbi:Domain of uncharacterised function (DUF397) [Mycobacterium tuberculosis]|nr:Domain of uncharacterised function (DUF397) [Mycobacterium tuberculosis]